MKFRYVKLMKVCHTYEGVSHLWRCVTFMKACHTYEGMSNLWRYFELMNVCQTYEVCHTYEACQINEGMSVLWRYVNFMKVGHTYEGMSNLWRYVKLMKVCKTYGGMSNLCRHVRLMKVCQNSWPFFGWFLPTVLAYRNLYISIWKASFLSSAAVFYWFCPWFTKVWIRCFYSKKEDAFLNSKGESKVCQLFFLLLC